jgi:hypothetical protein
MGVFRYRLELAHAHGTMQSLGVFFSCFWRFFIRKKTILFYPEGPRDFHAMYKLLKFLGYHTTSAPNQKFDIAIQWWLAFDGNPYAPENTLASILGPDRNGHRLLNIHGTDISKNVSAQHLKRFLDTR